MGEIIIKLNLVKQNNALQIYNLSILVLSFGPLNPDIDVIYYILACFTAPAVTATNTALEQSLASFSGFGFWELFARSSR